MIPKPILSPYPEKRSYLVNKDYIFWIDKVWPDYDGNPLIRIPKYYYFDGASIPWFAWQLTYTPFSPTVITAALLHDWLYFNHHTTKIIADLLFKEVLLSCGAAKTKSGIMYLGVNFFGRRAYDTYSKEDKERYQILKDVHPNLTYYNIPEIC